MAIPTRWSNARGTPRMKSTPRAPFMNCRRSWARDNIMTIQTSPVDLSQPQPRMPTRIPPTPAQAATGSQVTQKKGTPLWNKQSQETTLAMYITPIVSRPMTAIPASSISNVLRICSTGDTASDFLATFFTAHRARKKSTIPVTKAYN